MVTSEFLLSIQVKLSPGISSCKSWTSARSPWSSYTSPELRAWGNLLSERIFTRGLIYSFLFLLISPSTTLQARTNLTGDTVCESHSRTCSLGTTPLPSAHQVRHATQWRVPCQYNVKNLKPSKQLILNKSLHVSIQFSCWISVSYPLSSCVYAYILICTHTGI